MNDMNKKFNSINMIKRVFPIIYIFFFIVMYYLYKTIGLNGYISNMSLLWILILAIMCMFIEGPTRWDKIQ